MDWNNMSWDDIEDVLFDGTMEQIEALRCPECGGELRYSYTPQYRNTEIVCKACYIITRSHGAKAVPNFARFAGVGA